MTDPASIMLDIGVIATAGFVGALLASRARVSVIVGYIVAGILIGPHIDLEVLGLTYGGLLQETVFIQSISQMGLVLLLFFVGLEFSVAKLRKTKEAAAILAVTNLGVNMFAGFAIGAWLGWPLVDTIFMAGVISMSSSAIVAKSLIDLKRLGNAETEFLLGMVILESFLAMFLLTLVNGMIVPADVRPGGVGELFLGVGIFLGVFTFLAAIVVPNTARLFERIKSEELFVLFALALVFLAAALAESFRIPAIVGAFFMGMVFADTRIAGRMRGKMESLRDAFVAIFFLSFGMLIDPAALPAVLPILVIAVPLILLNDLFLTASLAYFIGFGARASTAIGTSLVARNEEAILYASVGTRAIRANDALTKDYAGTYLTPFTGILCIVMSGLAPLLMSRSEGIATFFARRLPKSITFGAEIVKRTLKTIVMPNFLPIYRRKKLFQVALIVYAAWIIDLLLTSGTAHVVLSLFAPILIYAVWAVARQAFQDPVRHTNYGTASGPFAKSAIEAFVLRVVVGALTTTALVAIVWQYAWPATLAILYLYFLSVVYSMKHVYRRLGLGTGRRTVGVRVPRASRFLGRGWATNGGFRR
ncbi:MAG TPA: cation:proton antiporter [Thermoplasmata archaeon]|nr:cation:proton antiporter [Thermoplasmata archaeon]